MSSNSIKAACAWVLSAAVLATAPLCMAHSAAKDGAVPPALQEVRRHMLDASVNTLTFHSMDQLFDTRDVTRSGPVWALPKQERALDYRYSAGGISYGAEEFMDRTFSNALLILKHGTLVYEQYRNLTHDRTKFISGSSGLSVGKS